MCVGLIDSVVSLFLCFFYCTAHVIVAVAGAGKSCIARSQHVHRPHPANSSSRTLLRGCGQAMFSCMHCHVHISNHDFNSISCFSYRHSRTDQPHSRRSEPRTSGAVEPPHTDEVRLIDPSRQEEDSGSQYTSSPSPPSESEHELA
jgi:hypothetical protein